MLEIRREGNELVGVIVQEGRAATGGRAEVFAPDSVQWAVDGIDLLPEHLATSEVKAIPERQADGRISIRATATDALKRAYADGRRYLSVEFHSLREVRTRGGIREIQKAIVIAAAMVKIPEYNMAHAEIRQGGFTLRSLIPTFLDLSCSCSGFDCDFAFFDDDSMDAMYESIDNASTARPIVSAFKDFGSVLGSANKGSVRAVRTRQGMDVEIDVPVSQAGEAVEEAIESSGVITRPYIDSRASEYTKDGRVARYGSKTFLRGVIVSSPPERTGWAESEIVEGRGALVIPSRKRRIWL